jgi:hypothetical protein
MGAVVRWGHGIGPDRRGWSGLPGLLLTQGTVRLLRQARGWFGLGGTLALRSDGLEWCLGSSAGWARPEVRQHEAQPEQGQDHQLLVDEVWYHGMTPLHGGERGPFYPVFERSELSADLRYTTVRVERHTR